MIWNSGVWDVSDFTPDFVVVEEESPSQVGSSWKSIHLNFPRLARVRIFRDAITKPQGLFPLMNLLQFHASGGFKSMPHSGKVIVIVINEN